VKWTFIQIKSSFDKVSRAFCNVDSRKSSAICFAYAVRLMTIVHFRVQLYSIRKQRTQCMNSRISSMVALIGVHSVVTGLGVILKLELIEQFTLNSASFSSPKSSTTSTPAES